jgi:hypothetical protein
MTDIDPKKRLSTLSKREKQVLEAYCRGLEFKDIANELFLSKNTVTTHMGNIYRKLYFVHMEKRLRIAAIINTYCPLLNNLSEIVSESDIILTNTPELPKNIQDEEKPKPVSDEIINIVKEDEYAIILSEPPKIIIPPEEYPQGPRINWLSILMGIILGAGLVIGAFMLFGGELPTSNIEDPLMDQEELSGNSLPISTGLPEIIIPSDTPVIIVVTATSPPASKTPVPSYTPVPTKTQVPTNTPIPSPTAIPNTIPGSILEISDWWKEDDVWLRISEYTLDEYGQIGVLFEFSNRTIDTISFNWNTTGNFSMLDNNQHLYPAASWKYDNVDNNVIIQPGEIVKLDGRFSWLTVSYKDTIVFNADVTELIITVENLSRIDLAQFKIILNK